MTSQSTLHNWICHRYAMAWKPMLLIQRDGRRVVIAVCSGCDLKLKTLSKKEWPQDWETLPVHHDNTCWLCSGDGCEHCCQQCERCGSWKSVEWHHWAPRHLFDDAETWPQSSLCRECHMEWHRVVTPNMGRKGAA